ncbi:MAG: hypothetical protein AAGE59_20420 [Cyanobacteria bacterium P01_F01_bin.86]
MVDYLPQNPSEVQLVSSKRSSGQAKTQDFLFLARIVVEKTLQILPLLRSIFTEQGNQLKLRNLGGDSIPCNQSPRRGAADGSGAFQVSTFRGQAIAECWVIQLSTMRLI